MRTNPSKGRSAAFLVALSLVIGACSGTTATTAPATAAPPSAQPTAAGGSASPSQASKWDQVLAEAKGQTVNWYMWGGDETINKFVTGFINDEAQKAGVTVNQVPINDTVDAVNKVLGEKSAGKNDNGSVDLIWINGENFATMQQAGALYCGWVHDQPNDQYIDWNNPTVATDFGIPVGDCESPWSLAQFCMIYDSAKVPNPPTDAASLIAWIKANPGKFTYPAIPDFTGSVFVRQMLYYTNGGFTDLLGPFDQAKYDAVTPKLWSLLNDLKPSLWRQGTTYPQSSTALDQLYANGEVVFDMSYAPTLAAQQVEKGVWPATTREFVFDKGMIGNVSYVAIPYNSPHKAAAQVLANVLLEQDAQYKAIDTGVGYPAINTAALPPDQKARFDDYAFPPQVAPLAVLSKDSNPELQAKWATSIEAGWTKNVLQK